MKIGVVSDVHSNAAGLKAALALMGDVDELFCLGDSINDYRFSNEVVACLRERRAHIIQGNHEETFYSKAGVRARANPGNDPLLVDFLADQPTRRILRFGNLRLLLVHSTPWDPRGAYLYPHSKDLHRFADADADVVLYGHTHYQLVRRIGRVLVINPGSAGAARDPGNGKQPSCAVLDTDTAQAQVIDYPDPLLPLPSTTVSDGRNQR